jgi:hypothetical protein
MRWQAADSQSEKNRGAEQSLPIRIGLFESLGRNRMGEAVGFLDISAKT